MCLQLTTLIMDLHRLSDVLFLHAREERQRWRDALAPFPSDQKRSTLTIPRHSP